MTINILYLYYDILNLYGESGNIKVLKKQLELQNIEAVVTFKTIGEELEFQTYDFIYIGSGTEENQKIALKHLMKYQKEIETAYQQGKFFLITGNALELFGKSILDIEGKKYKALNLFSFTAKQESFRMVDECVFHCPLFKKNIIGFQNQSGTMHQLKEPFFEVKKGIGSYPGSKGEGIHQNNFYGTYLIGPILARNPFFTKYLVKELVSTKDPNFSFKRMDFTLENRAYQHFMEQFEKEYLEEKDTNL